MENDTNAIDNCNAEKHILWCKELSKQGNYSETEETTKIEVTIKKHALQWILDDDCIQAIN